MLLDDPKTVQLKHASIVLQNGDSGAAFVLSPIAGGRVHLNGNVVPPDGAPCRNGDMVEIGSARLIFFTKTVNLKEGAVHSGRDQL
jgi:hypothetical protein